MSIIATALKHLIAAGVSGDDLVRAVADMEAAQPTPVDKVAEKRRAYDRKRKREESGAKRLSGGIPPESAEPPPPKDNIQNPHPRTGSSEPVKTARAHRLPDGWEPALTTEAKRKVDGWPPGRYAEVLAAFRDHASDKGRTSKDWQAAFRTWIANEHRWNRNNVRPLRPADAIGSLRGHRPNGALDMVLQSERELQAEAERENPGADWPPRTALPPY